MWPCPAATAVNGGPSTRATSVVAVQQKSAPSAVSPHSPPDARRSNGTGEECRVGVAASFHPQHSGVPSANAHVCQAPAETSVKRAVDGIVKGVVLGVVDPSPISPYRFPPQHITSPAVLSPHVWRTP